MSKKFTEYKGLDLAALGAEVLTQWDAEETFRKSIETRKGHPTFVFYEGPPSANGVPGIHHVMARTIKDVFCRYKTQKGFLVHRKAGWDTHGLPVELGVEKKLGITKEDIGKTISIEDYNRQCRKAVMEYTGLWNKLTRQMGYWVDMENPYITYDNKYIETLWWMLKQLYEKGLLYKGYTIQPYSPAAGTGLSNHELNQPGCYRDVKDTTCTAQFKIIRDERSEALFAGGDAAVKGDLYFLAWTTTPWTLPSNMALAVGPNIRYVQVICTNPYTGIEQTVILAKDLLEKTMAGAKITEYTVVREYTGSQLEGIRYEQLIPWIKPALAELGGDAFRVIVADYVTVEDGTGIVHIAATFGADDDRVSKQSGIAPMLLLDKAGKWQPMVDRTGKFFLTDDLDPEFVAKYVDASYGEFAGKFVKNAYDPAKTEKDETLDVEICMMLKANNQAFKIEKHTHNYPHCWRTDKPVLYYPLDSWFIRTTAVKDKLIELNKTINWKPASTGEGRFGKWLENLVDWNLSRSRYWGTPLPIWATEDHSELKCIGSVAELKQEIDRAIAAGLMTENPLASYKEGDFSKANYDSFDLHRPYVDNIVLVSSTGKPMRREPDLIDVWFDSGAMPYAQVHYPFEVDEVDFKGKIYPADFIAEGVDQTRGWFFTLHTLATMLFDSVAFRNIISNGLVLDKNGNKMSKRLGNAVDPFEVMDKFGADAVRWYMISNSQPWDNLKFDTNGVDEVRRKFFGTLYNTYSFFALYANVDGFTADSLAADFVPVAERPEIDRWIISLLNTLVKDVTTALEAYDPTPAARAIATFVDENLSNWYVRLNRKRFWGGGMTRDKLAAFQTLYTCLKTVSLLVAPFAPFISDRIYRDLTHNEAGSVHLAEFPTYDAALVDEELERRMELAQRASSMVLALRRKVNIKVRQPLQKMMIPVLDPAVQRRLEAVESLILNEVNVKEVEYLHETTGIITKRIKPNFKTLGPKYGKQMKAIAAAVEAFSQEDIAAIEALGTATYDLRIAGGEVLPVERTDFEITSEDMPGWLVATEGTLTIALDIEVTPELRTEGIARELVNRIQNLRKEQGFEVTDKIRVVVESNPETDEAVRKYADYIAAQTLAQGGVSVAAGRQRSEIEIDELPLTMTVERIG
ncbi:isoleucine--tRNA ligase [uncultured Rikenella sp.]|uniref:isoleucine--tRNA ligase n=1 Tax=uncultured Rikenella sp. TaxID=368003 RepID=UPI0025EBDA91|nr:isoleucine--tRNA ligase [uncultured Rikenella sp.]